MPKETQEALAQMVKCMIKKLESEKIGSPIRTVAEYNAAHAAWLAAMSAATRAEDDEEEQKADETMRLIELRLADAQHLFTLDEDGNAIGLVNAESIHPESKP